MARLVMYRCPRCERQDEVFVPYGVHVDCLDCYDPEGPIRMDRVFSPPALRGDTVART